MDDSPEQMIGSQESKQNVCHASADQQIQFKKLCATLEPMPPDRLPSVIVLVLQYGAELAAAQLAKLPKLAAAHVAIVWLSLPPFHESASESVLFSRFVMPAVDLNRRSGGQDEANDACDAIQQVAAAYCRSEGVLGHAGMFCNRSGGRAAERTPPWQPTFVLNAVPRLPDWPACCGFTCMLFPEICHSCLCVCTAGVA